ncbi:hypothetical protein ACOMHN_058532 [Nucella lapillus]
MPVLCCGSSSVQVHQPGTPPAHTPCASGEDENNNEGQSREGEVAEDSEYAQATLTHTNGLSGVKASPPKVKDEVSTDPDTTATSAREDSNLTLTSSRRARKLPKKKASIPAAEAEEGHTLSDRDLEKSTPVKKRNNKKSSFRETEEVELSPLDPGFYNSATLQSGRQLYAQHTFEEEDEEFVDRMEEERRKNKQRQRIKKKQGSSTAHAPTDDATQAAYERAQQEIDRVLGPRQTSHSSSHPGPTGTHRNMQRSRRHSKKRGSTTEEKGGEVAALAPSESLEDMKSRVHSLLDDAFSLLTNSYTSMG